MVLDGYDLWGWSGVKYVAPAFSPTNQGRWVAVRWAEVYPADKRGCLLSSELLLSDQKRTIFILFVLDILGV